jgi:acyl-CoA thioester hydrolase
MAERTDLPSRARFGFFHGLRVRWSELDPQGIVFNPNYLVYFDIAVTEYLRKLDFVYPRDFSAAGSDMFAVHSSLNFCASARYDDEIAVGVRAARLGRTSFAFELGIFRDEELLVYGSLVYVNASAQTRKPQPVPTPFVDKVLAFERLPPERD